MISQTRPYVDIYNRIGDSEKWENTYVDKMEQTIRIADFNVEVADVYLHVKFPEPENSSE